MGIISLDTQYIDSLNSVDIWFEEFNSFIVVFFNICKYAISIVFLLIAIIILVKTRKNYINKGAVNILDENGDVNKSHTSPNLSAGIFYLILSIGFLANFFIYFLIIILDPIPDRFILLGAEFSNGFNSLGLNLSQDLNSLSYTYEKGSYYLVSLLSFVGFILSLISIMIFAHKFKRYYKIGSVLLIIGILLGIFMGFTTYLPFLL